MINASPQEVQLVDDPMRPSTEREGRQFFFLRTACACSCDHCCCDKSELCYWLQVTRKTELLWIKSSQLIINKNFVSICISIAAPSYAHRPCARHCPRIPSVNRGGEEEEEEEEHFHAGMIQYTRKLGLRLGVMNLVQVA